MKRLFVLAAALLFLVVLGSAWQSASRPQPVLLVPTITGQAEYCLTCHADLPEISSSHPVASFGCVLCHGGERLALDADLAHSTMRGGNNPSDFSVVEASCGGSDCHSGDPVQERDHIQRVKTSLQATYAGAIASILYTFGEQPDLSARYAISTTEVLSDTLPAVGESTNRPTTLLAFDPTAAKNPAVLSFAANCLTCHLDSPPASNAKEYDRLTGCSACHTPTTESALSTIPEGSPDAGAVHKLTVAIPYTQCNTCHNRGNYDLRSMQFQPRSDAPADRLHAYYQPIAQFTKCEYELDCVDCHTRQEVMGDGHLYNNQKEIQYVQCKDCHGTLTEPPRTRPISDVNDMALRLAFLNPAAQGDAPLKLGSVIVYTSQNEPLWNVRQQPDGSLVMTGKVTGERFTVPLVMGSACQQKPGEQESRYCHACHAVER